jgi:protein-L-isoaspartate(D-aspartate) O-methyltransferase
VKGRDKKNREKMVAVQIEARGIKNTKVLSIMRKLPRHLFVPVGMKSSAYSDEPLPIGEGQTISQPYIVAYMTEALSLKKHEKVLEVGTGSGYQTAILAEMVHEVYTVEMVVSLSEKAQKVLVELGYKNIYFKIADGTYGWKENAPYDAVMVTAAPSKIPKELISQLKIGGRLIIPVGDFHQDLVLIVREKDGFHEDKLLPVRFVPLVTTQ